MEDPEVECNCPYPYTGRSCQTIDYCSGIDCEHGTCSEVVNGTGTHAYDDNGVLNIM